MCGIAGILSYSSAAPPVEGFELLRIRDHMHARGPDACGHWISKDARVGLAHRRLSIIDLSERSSQPMSNESDTLVVTFNGEIYNYKELRRELIQKGFKFRTSSDTEVLLYLYEAFGSEMVQRLRGMFAFALWDGQLKQLLLARDPLGIKPLYYADDGRTLRFASQVRALLAGGGIAQDVDPAAWAGFYLLGSVPEPFTTSRAVRSLPAGAVLEIAYSGSPTLRRYYSIADTYVSTELAPPVDCEAPTLRDALIDSVHHHLVADVPVGCFLSAGIDSCALLALMSELSQTRIRSITLGFSEFRGTAHDEVPLAELAANTYGAEHNIRIVDRAEFFSDLERIVAAMDQPSIDGINTWFVSKAAHELGLKVAISGLGGDELFGGYSSFSDIPAWVRNFAALSRVPGLGRATRHVVRSVQSVKSFGSPKLGGIIEYGGTLPGAYLLRRGLYMPWELGSVIDQDMANEGLELLRPLELINSALTAMPTSGFAQVATLEMSLYMRNQLLRDTDWASMSHSLEVRVPLVDHVLLERVARMRNRPRKGALASAPRKPLPAEISNRPKTGFATPVGAWLEVEQAHRSRSPLRPSRIDSRNWAPMLAEAWSRCQTNPSRDTEQPTDSFQQPGA